jgi:hypothetical protein
MLTWQLTVQVVRSYSDMEGIVDVDWEDTCRQLDESMYDTWQIVEKWYDATWPTLGLPCGTPSLDS